MFVSNHKNHFGKIDTVVEMLTVCFAIERIEDRAYECQEALVKGKMAHFECRRLWLKEKWLTL
jgi:hypothetical protein